MFRLPIICCCRQFYIREYRETIAGNLDSAERYGFRNQPSTYCGQTGGSRRDELDIVTALHRIEQLITLNAGHFPVAIPWRSLPSIAASQS
jgi:hypothetical protein